MRRRDFIKAIGYSPLAWPLTARTQQAVPVIGYLSARSPIESENLLAAFRRGLTQNGSVEDRNMTIEYRWALGDYNRLPGMASELVHRSVAVLVTVGGEASVRAAIAATSTIPIVGIFAEIPLRVASSRALIGPAEIPLESSTLIQLWSRSDLGCCMNLCRRR